VPKVSGSGLRLRLMIEQSDSKGDSQMPVKALQIETNAPKVKRNITLDMAFLHDTIEEDIKAYGGTVVKSKFDAQSVVDFQSLIRRALEKGVSDDDIRALAKAHKPGVTQRVAANPRMANLNRFKGLSRDEQLAEIENLKALIAAKK